MEVYKPPYDLTEEIVNLVASISEVLGAIKVNSSMNVNPQLRRDNRVKTIQASLAIENNSLTLEQVTDIINGKRILGKPNEIKEVKNAYEAYNRVLTLDPYSMDDLLYTHKILMSELTSEAGMLRTGNVGVFSKDRLIHMAPPAHNLSYLINNLLNWVKNSNLHSLIKSCVFHYEFEFIHPFTDGNGRMGRMWQTLLLYQWDSLFGWLPIETLIKENQEEYYHVLGVADRMGESTVFIHFMLEIIESALKDLSKSDQVGDQVSDQVKKLIKVIGDEEMSATELMQELNLKHRPTFRKNYLLPALDQNLIEMTVPDKPNSNRQKYKKKRK